MVTENQKNRSLDRVAPFKKITLERQPLPVPPPLSQKTLYIIPSRKLNFGLPRSQEISAAFHLIAATSYIRYSIPHREPLIITARSGFAVLKARAPDIGKMLKQDILFGLTSVFCFYATLLPILFSIRYL